MPQPLMPSDDTELRDVWCSAARRATDAQLAACAAVAIVAALAFGVLLLVDVRRTLSWWPLLLLSLFIGALGTWGIADRELTADSEDGRRRLSGRALSAVKTGAAIAAGVVGVLAAVGVLRLTIGTWIS